MLYMASYIEGDLIDKVEPNGEITASCEIYSADEGDFLGTATFNLTMGGEVALLGTTISEDDYKKYDIKMPEMEKMIENDIADTVNIRAELGDYFMNTLQRERTMTMELTPAATLDDVIDSAEEKADMQNEGLEEKEQDEPEL